MGHKDKKKKKNKKHKKGHKKEKKRQQESFEDVSSESSSDLSSSSSSSSSDSEGEDNTALTKAKAMLKFRENFQKRLEQRERAAGKSKSNVKELFDSSVPLDIEDLKAEFDNAPAPRLDSDDILRGGQGPRSKKNQKLQDFSNVTIGKLPSKGSLAKAKPEKLVNQFFAKELVNPKPKASIKIGLISSKIDSKKTIDVTSVALPPDLDVCPVTPPDGYSIRSRDDAKEEQKTVIRMPPKMKVQDEAKRSGPRIIHQVSEPDPEPEETAMETVAAETVTPDTETHHHHQEEAVAEGLDGETTEQEVLEEYSEHDSQSFAGRHGPAPLPPANYCSAPAIVKRDDQPREQTPPVTGQPQQQFNQQQFNQQQFNQQQFSQPRFQAGTPPPNTAHPVVSQPSNYMPPFSQNQQQFSQPHFQTGTPPNNTLSVSSQHKSMPNFSQQYGQPRFSTDSPPRNMPPFHAAGAPPTEFPPRGPPPRFEHTHKFDPSRAPPFDANNAHSMGTSNGAPLDHAHTPPRFERPKAPVTNHQTNAPPFDHSKMHPFDPSKGPPFETTSTQSFDHVKMSTLDPSKAPTYDPSKASTLDPSKAPTYDPTKPSASEQSKPPLFDPSKMPPNFDPSKMPPFDVNKLPPGFDPSKMPPGFDPSKMPPGFDPSKMPPGFDPNKMPPGFDPNKMPPGFDPSKMPPGFDPSKIPPGFDPSKMPPGFDPSKMPPGFDPSKMPPGFDPSKMPPGFDPSKMPPFDPKMKMPFPPPAHLRPPSDQSPKQPNFELSKFPPAQMLGRPPFDPNFRQPQPMPTMDKLPMFRPPPFAAQPYPEHSRKRSHHDIHRSSRDDRDRDHHHERSSHDRDRDHHDRDHHDRDHHDRDHRSSSYDRYERQGSPYKKKYETPTLNGHHPPPFITPAQWNQHDKPNSDAKSTKSPTTPEIDPRAVREALRFLQGTSDIDDDVVRRALMSIKSKQQTEKVQKSYSAGPTSYNFVKPEAKSPEIQPSEAEEIVAQVQQQQQLEQQKKELAEMMEEHEERATGPDKHVTGPEIPAAGLPEPDLTPATDLDKSDWQIAPTKEQAVAGEEAAGYTFPPEPLKDTYSDYYMHYYQQAYSLYPEEKDKPLEAKYPVSQGYGHKRALEKGGAVKGTGRAVLFNKEEIQSLVLKRKKIAQDMVMDPSSPELMDQMEAVQKTLNECGVTETEISMMETSQMQNAWKKRRAEDMNCPAWTRADMFFQLPMVRSTYAINILKKQGWIVGQRLGRGCPYGSAFGEGSLQPLEFYVKTDQAGLVCEEERVAMKAKKYSGVMPTVITEQLPAPRTTVSGRHPIAALADLCHKRKWKQPEYTLVKEDGVDHKKLFYYQVGVKCGKFMTPNGARNKRKAKADAAQACLERLGLMTSLPPGYS